MKHTLFLKFFCCAVLTAAAGFVSAEESIVIRAAKGAAPDWAKSEKIFSENKSGEVFHLTKLTGDQQAQVAAMPDMNRLKLATQKAAEEEYHYTLESASAQWEKELQKNNAIADTEKKTEKAAPVEPGEAAFFVTANAKEIIFTFRNSTIHPGKYEIFLDPMEAGRFGHQGIHYLFDQTSGTAEHIGWNYVNGAGTLRYDSNLSLDGSILTRFTIPLASLINVLGEIPLHSGRSALWRVSVFRWDGENSSSLRGVPHEDAATYLILPVVSRKDELAVKSGAINGAITGYYAQDHKTERSKVEEYFDARMGEAKQIHFYKLRMGVNPRLGYPYLFAECYLASMPRRIAKEVVGDKEKTKELDYRWLEWGDEQEERGGFLKKEAENAAIVDEMIRLYLQPFYNIQFGFEILQLESVRHRTLTNLLLKEEFFNPKDGSEPYHQAK